MLIYILTNISMPGVCKVGYTDDIEARLKKLNRSEFIPEPFTVFATYETKEGTSEKALKEMLSTMGDFHPIEAFDERRNTCDSFFADDPEAILAVFRNIAAFTGTLDRLHAESLDEEDEEKPEKMFVRRRNWTFEDYGLKPGDILQFMGSDGDQPRSVKVVNARKVEADGEVNTLTNFGKRWSGKSTTCTQMFTFNGETLWEIRKRLEKEKEMADSTFIDDLPFN